MATTVVIGNNTGNDYSGTEDAHLRYNFDYSSNNNFGGKTSFEATKYEAGDHTHGLIKFSGLSNITGPVAVSSAVLYLYLQSASSVSNTISFFRLLRSWIEGTQNDASNDNDSPSSCSWYEYGGGSTWSTAGALGSGTDRASTATAAVAISNTIEYKSITLTSDVEDMINGDVNNYGWHLERTDGANDSAYRVFTSSEGADGSRPYISVTYTEGGSTGNTYYYQQMQM